MAGKRRTAVMVTAIIDMHDYGPVSDGKEKWWAVEA